MTATDRGATTTGPRPRSAHASRGRGPRAVWIPKQHGAWAMLTVPFVVGAVRGGLAPAQAALFVTWFVGYLCFAAAGLWLRSRLKPVHRAPVLAYGLVCAVAGLVLLAMRPDLLLWAPVFAPYAALSLWYSWRRKDRALANDVVTIVAACLMTLVAASAGRLGSVAAAVTSPVLIGMTLALTLYFVGTSLYVKTLIRERNSAGYRRASIAYHAAATLLWAVVPLLLPEAWAVPVVTTVLLVVFFAVTTVRAAVMAGRRVRPMKVGLGEIALSAVLMLILLLTW